MELRVPHQHGWSISVLAREFGLSRNTVKRELESPEPRRYPARAKLLGCSRMGRGDFAEPLGFAAFPEHAVSTETLASAANPVKTLRRVRPRCFSSWCMGS